MSISAGLDYMHASRGIDGVCDKRTFLAALVPVSTERQNGNYLMTFDSTEVL